MNLKWITNSPSGRVQSDLAGSRPFGKTPFVGNPYPSDIRTIEQLKAWGMVGIYVDLDEQEVSGNE